MGVDASTDEIVLMKIMEVLRLLFTSPVGLLLTNESVCEIMQSTFRICFENRLTELLRKTAEHSLNEMIQLLFTRLPNFSEENLPLLKKLKMRNPHGESAKQKKKHSRPKTRMVQSKSSGNIPQEVAKETTDVVKLGSDTGSANSPAPLNIVNSNASLVTSPSEPQFNVDADVLARSPLGSVADLTAVTSDNESTGGPESLPNQTSIETEEKQAEDNDEKNNEQSKADLEITVTSPKGTERPAATSPEVNEDKTEQASNEEDNNLDSSEFVNAQGVTFTPTTDMVDEAGSLIPYGLPCVRELFRFLVSLINPNDNHNHDSMIQIALSLLATALETGAQHLDKFESLLLLVKDELARNLVSLLSAERIATFSSSLWLSFMVFESQRKHLKYQLEIFLNRLNEVVCSESPKITYEHKELALEIIVRFYRIPGFLTQLYLNFDCGMYTTNIFEDLTKMLSKNAFPVTGLYSTHFLSLDALLTVVESIEDQCQKRISARNGPNKTNDASGEESGKADTKEGKFPTHEEVMALKHRKKLISTATEQFNTKPTKGVAYMQECNLIQKPLIPDEVVTFMRQNPHLNKQQIGDYISNRKHLDILEAYVKSFDFAGLRIDESLRMFLEAFRLPGEAPLITLVLEHFADHWHKSNLKDFSNHKIHDPDSAFTLSYAVIMLNVDQHNKNHTKTNDPMTEEQFKRNLRSTNNNENHNQDMLHEIYHAIRNEEIVMPAEQTGLVKENYLWKCVLKRGQDEDNEYLMAPNGYFDHDLFSIIWGPTVAALSYVFDKSQEKAVIERAVQGFQRCAMIAAHYRMSDVFDNLIISICKFTTLLTVADTPYVFIPIYGKNEKALLATRMVFSLVQKHGDILRDGWKNITECLLQLFKCQLLPKSLMESEDYIESSGRVRIFREDNPVTKVEPGFLNSFVSFISMSSETQQKTRTPEEEEAAKVSVKCIKDCNLEALVTESKFLLAESLQELVKFLISGSHLDDVEDEHARLFFLEFLVRITIQNRDRVQIIWTPVADHLARLIMSSTSPEKSFMLERSVTALLRLTVRLSRKEDLASTVVQSLDILRAMKVNLIFHVSRHIAYGIYELLRNNAANIHEAGDWAIIFALIEVVGAGANPNTITDNDETDSGQESEATGSRNASPKPRERSESVSSGGWIVLESTSNNIAQKIKDQVQANRSEEGLLVFSDYAIIHPRAIVMHDAMSYLKCCESLAFLIRDVAHITPHNFGHCVMALRTFVEASFTARSDPSGSMAKGDAGQTVRSQMKRTPPGRAPPMRRALTEPSSTNVANLETEEQQPTGDLSSEYLHVALQLLDLLHTLHTRAGQIHESWAQEGTSALPEDSSLWTNAWCPLLQGMARLCCDKRSHIRTSALTTLQRALLFHDLQRLSSTEWEDAFRSVLFPLLNQLLIKSNPGERTAMEETRMRAATLLGKVFLQHLTPLSTLESFTALWVTILDFMHKFIQAAASDLLADAVPESLKNMLLVMDTAGIFYTPDGQTTPVWRVTWEKLESFLPKLMDEVFGHREKGQAEENKVVEPTAPTAELVMPPPETEVGNVKTQDENEIPPASPLDPPYLHSSAFTSNFTGNQSPDVSLNKNVQPFNIGPPPPLPSSTMSTAVTVPLSIPAPPEIGSLPPPPVSITPLAKPTTVPLSTSSLMQGFQPIEAANQSANVQIPMATPRPIPAPNPQLATYFHNNQSGESGAKGAMAGNILTAAFTPTFSNQANTVFLNSPTSSGNPPTPTSSSSDQGHQK